LEFDFRLISARSAFVVSAAGIAAPLAAGGMLGFAMGGSHLFFGAGVVHWQAALFLGAAMSITAFPVLARIIEDRGIRNTRVGTLSFAASACGDVVAWLLFAAIIASLPGGSAGAFLRSNLVFGALLLGALARKLGAPTTLDKRIRPVATFVLVPVFFAYSGLNTRLPLLASWSIVAITLLVLVVSSVAKGLACGLAARREGFNLRESAALGALMNARGLMELILLNIGLEAGIITPTLFTILAVMAILTTFAATPGFELASSGVTGHSALPAG
jgi:Kef-type K+ transport system membrane component KefB